MADAWRTHGRRMEDARRPAASSKFLNFAFQMRLFLLILSFVFLGSLKVNAQCSICTKTAQQLGEKPAKGMNGGILYLAFAPFAIVGIIAYRYVKGNKS